MLTADFLYKPRPLFIPYHRRSQRFALTVAHRRSGKTVAEVNEGILKICHHKRSFPVPQVVFLSPTYAQAKRNVWGYLKHYTSNFPDMKYYENELTAVFPTGGKMILAGSDNFEPLRGTYADHCSLDEFGTQDPRVWGSVVRPSLSDYKGTATFIGSANGMNHFKQLYDDHIGDPEWFISNHKASETDILSTEELAAARSTMTPEQYAQEYENDFYAAVTGTFYGAEISALDRDYRITSVPYERASDVFAGWDLGLGGATAIWVYQRVGLEWRFLACYEGFRPDSGLEDAVNWIKGLPYQITEHFLPHDAEARELMNPGTTRKEFLEVRGLRCTVLPRGSVEDGINTVRVNFNKFLFDRENCAQGIEALRMYRSQYDDKRKVFSKAPVHDWSSHFADALRYSVMGMPDQGRMSDWSKPIRRHLRVVV